MAGHSKFKNIQHRKNAQDAKKAKIFAKIVLEIIQAAKYGTDPKTNPKLRTVLQQAKSVNLPKDRIEKAISNANRNESGVQSLYEGFINGCAIIVTVLAENKSSILSDLRSVFKKSDGQLVESGSARFLFDKVGIVEVQKNPAIDEEKIISMMSDEDVLDCLENTDKYTFIVTYNSEEHFTSKYSATLESCKYDAFVGYHPHNKHTLDDAESVNTLRSAISKISSIPNVQKVFCNVIF